MALAGLAGAGATLQFLAYLTVGVPFAAILGQAAVRVSSPRHESRSRCGPASAQLA